MAKLVQIIAFQVSIIPTGFHSLTDNKFKANRQIYKPTDTEDEYLTP